MKITARAVIGSVLALGILLSGGSSAAGADAGVLSKSPYRGSILIDAASGKVLHEDNPDALCYPASMVKLMNLLIIVEMIEKGALQPEEKVPVTAAAATMGGSQVYLKEKESMSLEDMLYALVVQSANDAATALAIHIAGTKEAFVDMMNGRAKELGMAHTTFHSVHGLPPGKGHQPAVSTPRDMARLSRELLKHPKALEYTSETVRTLRADSGKPFIMRTHNNLLGTFEGCDGLKTGYFRKAGYSIAATATRRGARAIAVVMGSTHWKERDAKARELLSRGLLEILASPGSGARQGAR
ncbi:MAG: D-alanyl-D-alanine carboxypeptidase [Candidatus Krumholzibacteria bacterium]|nr:D-alanyl-D-alanine carboxypeptidase [Candidatus Krumholzibacteria bacterium]